MEPRMPRLQKLANRFQEFEQSLDRRQIVLPFLLLRLLLIVVMLLAFSLSYSHAY